VGTERRKKRGVRTEKRVKKEASHFPKGQILNAQTLKNLRTEAHWAQNGGRAAFLDKQRKKNLDSKNIRGENKQSEAIRGLYESR